MNNVKLARKFLWVLILTTVCSRGFAMDMDQVHVDYLKAEQAAQQAAEIAAKAAKATPGLFARGWNGFTSFGSSAWKVVRHPLQTMQDVSNSSAVTSVVSTVSAYPTTSAATTALVLAGAGVLAYKKSDKFKNVVDSTAKTLVDHKKKTVTGAAILAGLGATAYTGHLQTGVNSVVSAATTAWNSEIAKTVWGYANHPRIVGGLLAGAALVYGGYKLLSRKAALTEPTKAQPKAQVQAQPKADAKGFSLNPFNWGRGSSAPVAVTAALKDQAIEAMKADVKAAEPSKQTPQALAALRGKNAKLDPVITDFYKELNSQICSKRIGIHSSVRGGLITTFTAQIDPVLS